MLKKNTKQQKRSAWQALLQMYSNPGDSQRRMFPSCKLERKGAMSYVKVPIITDWNIASAGCGNATLLCIWTEWSLDNFDQNWAPRSWSERLAQESNAWNHVLAPRDIQLGIILSSEQALNRSGDSFQLLEHSELSPWKRTEAHGYSSEGSWCDLLFSNSPQAVPVTERGP